MHIPNEYKVKRLQLKSDSHVVWSLCSLGGSYAHCLVSRWSGISCVLLNISISTSKWFAQCYISLVPRLMFWPV